MSLPAKGVSSAFVMLALTLSQRAWPQTIADYSRAQRAWLENTMSQSAARAAGSAASAPPAPLSPPASGAPPIPALPRMASLPPAGPALQVSGVFESGSLAVAEVVVNATAYLVEPGQPVPGTTWLVEAVAIDRVVLARRGSGASGAGDAARRVVSLPAMR